MQQVPFSKNGLLNELPKSTGKKGWPWDLEVNPQLYSSKTDWPKISIVTPSYQQGNYLEQTIRSILLQNYPNLTYIIIDGGSTDNSVEILEKYSPFISYWVAEKDSGQPNAINKGLKLVTGDLFNWINSDDFLEPNALFELGQNFKNDEQIIAGSVNNFLEKKDHSNVDQNYFGIIKNKNLDLETYFTENGGFNFHQPGVWIGTKLIKNMFLDESLHFVFDTKFYLQVLEKNPTVTYIDCVLVNFRLHELSKTLKDQHKFGNDVYQIYQHYIDHGPASVSKKAKNGLDYMKWTAKLNAIASSSATKTQKITSILKGIWEKPSKRLTRFSLGCIKNIFLS